MTCERLQEHLDDLLDGTLEADLEAQLEGHAATCAVCEAKLKEARSLKAQLQALPVAGPTEGFFDRALTQAKAAEPPDLPTAHPSGRRAWLKGFGSALVAGIALWFVVIGFNPNSVDPGMNEVPGVSMAMYETRTVNLVFSANTELSGARLVVDLPEGIELEGQEGVQQVRYRTTLQKGKNVLPLRLVALRGSGGELVARLEHQDKQKTFRLEVNVS